MDHTIVYIQGLVSILAKHYIADIPQKIVRKKSLRECFNHMDIGSQQKVFEQRGKNEIKMLQLAKHAIVKTVWDSAAVRMINGNIKTHYCPEILRDSFYEGKCWSLEACEKHTIFSVQSGFYSIKGIHYLLAGLRELVKQYPDAKLYMTLEKPKKAKTLKEKAMALTYREYIVKLMDDYGLWNNVEFLGSLKEAQIVQRYLHSHAFVCASSMENESQSVSEAKILGVPTVASFVGGMVERIKHGEDGFHFQHNAPYMIAEYVGRIFEDDELALRLSKEAHKNASKLVDKTQNSARMLEIYNEISNARN